MNPPENQREVEVSEEAITGDNEAATKRRASAYERWFYICTCGHSPESHDFPEGGVFASGAPCRVRDCSCEGYDHITGKPDHPLNPLPADDPRAPVLCAQERERLGMVECPNCDDGWVDNGPVPGCCGRPRNGECCGEPEPTPDYAPCTTCGGTRFVPRNLRAAVEQAAQQERERVKEALREAIYQQLTGTCGLPDHALIAALDRAEAALTTLDKETDCD